MSVLGLYLGETVMAGRPSKLTDRQWGEIGRRLAQGESAASLSREFKVGTARISERFSGKTKRIKDLANKIVSLDQEVDSLPISERSSVITLSDSLKGIATGLASAGASGASAAAKLAKIANKMADSVDHNSTAEDFRPVAAALDTANRASSTGLGLIAANKGKGNEEAVKTPFTASQLRRMADLMDES
jgi:hypothetical protein